MVSSSRALLSDQPSILDSDLLWLTGLLVGTLLVGALILSWMEKWRKRQMSSDIRPADQLSSFRALFERGELSREEYDRIRARVARQMQDAPDALRPAPPSVPAPAPPPDPLSPKPPQEPQ